MSPVSVWTPLAIPAAPGTFTLFGVSMWPIAAQWSTPSVPVSTYTPCEIPISPSTKCDVPVSTWTKEEL
jgi:hypothetical protein